MASVKLSPRSRRGATVSLQFDPPPFPVRGQVSAALQ